MREICSRFRMRRSPFPLNASDAHAVCHAEFLVLVSECHFQAHMRVPFFIFYFSPIHSLIIIISQITGNGLRKNGNNDFRRNPLSFATYRLYRQRIIQTRFIH